MSNVLWKPTKENIQNSQLYKFQNKINTKFDLSLFMSQVGDKLAGIFNYCTDLFNQETIERISRNFERLLSAIVENSSTKIKDLRLLTDERRKQILVKFWKQEQVLVIKQPYFLT